MSTPAHCSCSRQTGIFNYLLFSLGQEPLWSGAGSCHCCLHAGRLVAPLGSLVNEDRDVDGSAESVGAKCTVLVRFVEEDLVLIWGCLLSTIGGGGSAEVRRGRESC